MRILFYKKRYGIIAICLAAVAIAVAVAIGIMSEDYTTTIVRIIGLVIFAIVAVIMVYCFSIINFCSQIDQKIAAFDLDGAKTLLDLGMRDKGLITQAGLTIELGNVAGLMGDCAAASRYAADRIFAKEKKGAAAQARNVLLCDIAFMKNDLDEFMKSYDASVAYINRLMQNKKYTPAQKYNLACGKAENDAMYAVLKGDAAGAYAIIDNMVNPAVAPSCKYCMYAIGVIAAYRTNQPPKREYVEFLSQSKYFPYSDDDAREFLRKHAAELAEGGTEG